MKRLSVLSLLSAMCIGLSGFAFGASSGPSTKVLTAKMTVSLAGTPTEGACLSAGYATVASCTTTTCSCITDSNATISGAIAGKGTAVVSITEDFGAQVAVTPGTAAGVCDPLYVDAAITSTLKGNPQTETMSMVLVACKALTSSGKGTVSGGFGIEPGAMNSAVGWGTVTGTSKSQVATITLKGSITQ